MTFYIFPFPRIQIPKIFWRYDRCSTLLIDDWWLMRKRITTAHLKLWLYWPFNAIYSYREEGFPVSWIRAALSPVQGAVCYIQWFHHFLSVDPLTVQWIQSELSLVTEQNANLWLSSQEFLKTFTSATTFKPTKVTNKFLESFIGFM